MASKKRTEFEIIRELNQLEKEIEKRAEGYMPAFGGSPMIELMKKKTQLKHELSIIRRTTATGPDAEAIKEHWRRQAQEERKKQEEEERKEKERIATAKKQYEKEVLEDEKKTEELLSQLSPEQARKLLKKLANKK